MIDGWDTGKWIADKSSGQERLEGSEVCVHTEQQLRQHEAMTRQHKPGIICGTADSHLSQCNIQTFLHTSCSFWRACLEDWQGDNMTDHSLIKCHCGVWLKHTHTDCTHTRTSYLDRVRQVHPLMCRTSCRFVQVLLKTSTGFSPQITKADDWFFIWADSKHYPGITQAFVLIKSQICECFLLIQASVAYI